MLFPAFAGIAQIADWKQAVEYAIDVEIDAPKHQMTGKVSLVYTNNSPDTLNQFFFHLYYNAFEPNSMMAERNRNLPDPDSRIVPRIWELKADEIGYHRISELRQNGRKVDFEIFDTLLKVDLNEPISPGTQVDFDVEFTSQIPLHTRRGGRDNPEGIDFSMTQWYPKAAGYDHRGWHADPYIGREFFAPFGSFDVKIRIPRDYTIAATGTLQNPATIGHGYDGMPAGPASGGAILEWHFKADNVHDFAWTADRDYVHKVFRARGEPDVHLFYQSNAPEGWQTLGPATQAMIRFFSENYGKYAWPQFTVVQGGDGGMEYPMMTLITGERALASLVGVTAHELAHMWYYGMLGSNESDYSWIDEGFGSYISAEAVRTLFGEGKPSHHSWAIESLRSAHQFDFFERMSTPADWFNRNASFGTMSYSGGEAIADMLGYVIGDETRDTFFLELYRRYLFGHPDPLSIEKVAEDVSGMKLDWFFDQWTQTRRQVDYAAGRVNSRNNGESWRTEVPLQRKGELVMPLDVRLTLADGSHQWVHVPLGITSGAKPVPPDWVVAAPWRWTFPNYELVVDLPQQVRSVDIDPDGRMVEPNRLNNSSRSLPMKTAWLRPPQPDSRHVGVGMRPGFAYAHDFGMGAGLQLRALAEYGRFPTHLQAHVWPQLLGDSDRHWTDAIDYDLRHSRPLFSGEDALVAHVALRKHLGIVANDFTISYQRPRPLAPSSGPRLEFTLAHLESVSDQTYRYDEFPWSRRRTFSGQMGIQFGGQLWDARATGEIVSSRSASGFTSGIGGRLVAQRRVPLGDWTVSGTGLVEMWNSGAAPELRTRNGLLAPRDAWGADGFRALSAISENALTEMHFVPVTRLGPVGPALVGQGVSSSNSYVGGELTLESPGFGKSEYVRALHFEAYASFGWPSDELHAEAGLRARYDIGGIRALDRWTRQSRMLENAQFFAGIPFWVNTPETSSAALSDVWYLGIGVSPF